MDTGNTVLGVLRKARDLVSSGQHRGIIDAISSLKTEASGPLRDCAYFALLETMMAEGEASISALAKPEGTGEAVALFDATIRRITSRLH